MPTSPILGIQQLTANQSQKEVTINDAINALEAASCGTLGVAFPTLTVTLSVDQFSHNFMFRANTSTADAILQVPHAMNGNPSERLFGVRNTTGHGLTVRSDTTGGGSIVIPDGEARLLAISDNDVFIAAEPGVAVAFIGLSDVPHAYTGKGGQALVATMAEDGLEFVALVKSINDLSDVDTVTSAPSTGQFLKWNGTGWVPSALPAGATTFLGLTDTPSDYSGAANKFLRVNGAGTGIEFIVITQVPTDGTSGQVLTKGSGSSYAWADATGGGGGGSVPDGGTTGQVLTKLSNTDGDADWEDPTGGSSGDSGLYRFGSFFTTTPVTNEVLLIHAVTDDFTLPANLVGSSFKITTNPSAAWSALLKKNGTTIATIAISTSGVVTCTSSEVDIVVNDVLTLVAPTTVDGLIAGVGFTIRGAGKFGSALSVSGVQQQLFAARCRHYDASFTGGEHITDTVVVGDFRGVLLQTYHPGSGSYVASTPLVVPDGKVCVLLHGEVDAYRYVNGDYAKMEIWNTTTSVQITDFGNTIYARSGSFFVQGADGSNPYPVQVGVAGDHIECRVYSANDGHTRQVGMEAIFAFIDPSNPSSFDDGVASGGSSGDAVAAATTKFYGSFDKWAAAKARGASEPARALFLGDSNVMGQGSVAGSNNGAFLTNFARRFADLQAWQTGSVFGNQNVGNIGTYQAYNTAATAVTGGWSVATGGADIVGGTFFTSSSGGGGHFELSPAEPFKNLRVYYPVNNSLNAAMTVTIDGTLVDTFSLHGTDGVAFKDYVISGSLTTHVVQIGCSGAGDAYFHALEINDGSTTPVFLQAGWSGAKAADLDSHGNAWSSRQETALIEPDFTFLYCTINDSDAQTSGSTYYHAMESIVRQVSAVSDGCIMVGIPANVDGTVSSYLNNLAIMLQQLAKDYGWSYYDYRQDFGHSWAKFNDTGYADPDGYHPNVTGHPFMAGKLDDFIGAKL